MMAFLNLRTSARLLSLGLAVVGLLVALGGCSSAPKPVETSTRARAVAADAVPKVEPKSRYGNMSSYVVLGKRYYTKGSSRDHVERGLASWYGKKFHGRKTSSGERYDMHRMTAAHKTLPLPTYALVTNLDNGQSAVVKVNDRGPFVGNRIIDLSYAAAQRLDMVNQGTARVEVRSIDPRDHGKSAQELLRLASADVGIQRLGRSPALAKRIPTSKSQQAAAATRTSSARAPSAFLDPGTATAAAGRDNAGATDGAPLFLQVGAFGSRGNAEQLKSRLIPRVDEPVSVHAVPEGQASMPLYKVQVGPVRSRTDAAALGRRLAALGIEKPVLVVR